MDVSSSQLLTAMLDTCPDMKLSVDDNCRQHPGPSFLKYICNLPFLLYLQKNEDEIRDHCLRFFPEFTNCFLGRM